MSLTNRDFFKVLKSGCNIGKLQVNNKHRFDPCLALYLYVMLYEKPPPIDPPNLKDMIRIIAQLGGFLGRKHDGDPGPVVLWRGLKSLYESTRTRETFSLTFGHTYG